VVEGRAECTAAVYAPTAGGRRLGSSVCLFGWQLPGTLGHPHVDHSYQQQQQQQRAAVPPGGACTLCLAGAEVATWCVAVVVAMRVVHLGEVACWRM
jgi:hypothetical protein